jgi:glycine reductase
VWLLGGLGVTSSGGRSPNATVPLGLPVYHILEDDARDAIPTEVWEDQVGLMADVLEVDAIANAVREFREQAPS